MVANKQKENYPMPTRETAPPGAPCWVDLLTSDADQARAFYTELFGWTAEHPAEEYGGYINFQRDGGRIAGCMSGPADAEPSNVWSVYLATDDAEKTIELAAANGGQLRLPAMVVGELGTMAYVGDPGGANVGIWQPGLHAGFAVFGERGSPSWFELQTREYDSSVDFYHTVFHWETEVAGDTPEFRYMTQKGPDGPLAGIMDASGYLPEGEPAKWSVYFGVDDTAAALAKIVELGGSVVRDAENTPYGCLGTATDPLGAEFRLVSPNEMMPARDSSA